VGAETDKWRTSLLSLLIPVKKKQKNKQGQGFRGGPKFFENNIHMLGEGVTTQFRTRKGTLRKTKGTERKDTHLGTTIRILARTGVGSEG